MGEIKPSFDVNRQVLGEIYPLDTPFNVIIDIAEICNFRCNYCFRSDDNKTNWGYAKDARLMDWETFTKIVEQIKEFPEEVKQISLSNHGEPLANRRLPEMVRYIKNQGIKSRISIHTNASLLDEDYAIELGESGIGRIVISLQGLTADKYKNICGFKIDYEKFYNNLRVLYEHKRDAQIDIKIADVALDDGEEHLFYDKFSLIADRVFVERIVPIWSGVDIPSEDVSTKNKYGEIFPHQECCPLIFHTIVITPNGDAYPCTQLLSKNKLGNISENSIKNMWNSSERRSLLMRQCTGQNPEICKNCYILQNSIYSKEDMIDDYRKQIYKRLCNVN